MNFVFYVIFRLVIHLFSSIHLIFFWEPGNILTNVPRLYRILFIILICLCINYADRCCINLDNWNIFQQHNWQIMRDFFVFTMITKTRPWRHIYHDIEIPRPKSHDIEIPRPKNHDIEIPRPKSHDIEFLWNSDPYAPWYKILIQI